MNIDYYRRESWVDKTFGKRGKWVLSLFAMLFVVGIVAGGCGVMQNKASDTEQAAVPVEQAAAPTVAPDQNEQNTEEIAVDDSSVDIDVDATQSSNMITYDITSVGRADPFMPSDEIKAFDEARSAAIAEANAHNAKIAEINRLKGTVVRQADDISPYSFNLPVPPTSLASADAAAAKITRTKVVGIMYNDKSPSAIINVDDKDYLVRRGDQIMGQEYKVLQINPSWITVGLGSNIYSASIGELFAKDELDQTKNDLYNLKNRFGGRKG